MNLDSTPAGRHNLPIDDEGVSNIFNTVLPDLDPHFLDEFLTSLDSDLYALMFGDVPVNTDSTWEYEDLEYFGDYVMGSAQALATVGDESPQSTEVTEESRMVRVFIFCLYANT